MVGECAGDQDLVPQARGRLEAGFEGSASGAVQAARFAVFDEFILDNIHEFVALAEERIVRHPTILQLGSLPCCEFSEQVLAEQTLLVVFFVHPLQSRSAPDNFEAKPVRPAHAWCPSGIAFATVRGELRRAP
jgi:hypothetical protein